MKFVPDFSTLRKNPVRKLREDISINVADLARETHVTPQVIRDIEKGLPASVSDSIQEYLASQFPTFPFDDEYQTWRKEKRNLVNLPPVGDLRISNLSTHPFAQYRKNIEAPLPDFCEWLCFPRFVLSHYESNQRRMPRVLQYEALPQAHMTEIEIRRLANMGEMFYIARERGAINEQQINSS
jgi:predicted transcriptional regulator